MRSNGRSRKQIPDLSLSSFSLLTHTGRPFAIGKLTRVLSLLFPHLNPHMMKSHLVFLTLSEMISLYIMNSASFFVLYRFSRPLSTMFYARQKRLLINE